MHNTEARLVLLAALCSLVCFRALVRAVDVTESEPRAVTTEELHGGGGWVTASDGVTRIGQRWNIDALRFEDEQIRGRITVSGSRFFDEANVEGQFSGRGVFGKLVDDEGKELASFEGAVTSTGASGTYRDRSGDVGEWAWEGQLKQSQP
jgi:hypothetical protein